MPGVASLEALQRAAADFAVTDLSLVMEPTALAAAQRSLDESGFLLLGEVHGVRENPLIARALMQAFGLTGLALEWHEDLAPVAGAFLTGGALADHPLLWSGDGRITAGHLAVLRERAAVGPLRVSGESGSAIAADVTTTSSAAGSAAASARAGLTHGCARGATASSWIYRRPGKRSCPSGPSHGPQARAPDSTHPFWDGQPRTRTNRATGGGGRGAHGSRAGCERGRGPCRGLPPEALPLQKMT